MMFCANADHDLDEAAHLPGPGRELLWSMRAWVVGARRKLPVEQRIRHVFREIGAPGAADPLFGLMWAIGLGTLSKLKVACVCEPRIGPDERLLLDVVGLYQQRRNLEAMLLLRSISSQRMVSAAKDNAERLANTLAAAGYHVNPPSLPAMQLVALIADDSPV